MKHIRKMTGKKQIAVVIAVVLGLSCVQNVTASALSNAKDKKNQAQTDLDNANAQIADIEGQQQELQSEIDALDADLVNILMNIDILEEELAAKQVELDEVTAELAQAEEDEQTQYDSMVKRIKYMYENGNDSFIEAVIGATDFADMLNRLEYAKQIYEYDRNLLTEYQETKQQVADLKTQVESEQAELLDVQNSYLEQQAEYETMIAAKQSEMTDFNTQLANAKDLAAQYKATIDEQNRIIQEEQNKKPASGGNSGGSTSGGNTSGGNTSDGGSSGGSSSGGTENGGGGDLNPPFVTSVSGSDVVAYACQFIGYPYVYGGTSLTNGADCSGFIMSVYANFGISLPHSSLALRSCGTEVSYANAQPGDIICYAGHVAIYMGGGQIVHASSPQTGIKTGNATYRSIITVRRVL